MEINPEYDYAKLAARLEVLRRPHIGVCRRHSGAGAFKQRRPSKGFRVDPKMIKIGPKEP